MSQLTLTQSGNEKRKDDRLVLTRQDVVDDDPPEPGAVVDLVDRDDHYRGRGFYSDRGTVSVHVLSNGKVEVDRDFFRERVDRAVTLRDRWYGSRLSRRLVNSEGDFLPGLIVDQYGDFLSVELRSQAMDRRRDTIVGVLTERLDPGGVYHRGDLPVRERLGLDRETGQLSGGSIPDLVEIRRDPYSIVADLKGGQKTGFYLDQAENRRRLESLESPGECLDCFCYSGAWGLALLHAGADRVTFVDRSSDALDLVRENVRRNGWENRVELIECDGFDYLEEALESERTFDTAVLDPPAFAKSRDQYREARSGYKGINFRAMRLLKPRGLLATSSCSHPIDMDTFTEIITDSAHDAHVNAQILERRYQSSDHPWLSRLPQSRYLTCIFAEISLV